MAPVTLAEQHQHRHTQQVRRRQALKLLGLSALGLTAGGGGAWAQQQLTTSAAQQTSLTELQTQLNALTASYTALQQNHATLQTNAGALQTQATTLNAALNTATAQNNQLTINLASAQQTAQLLQAQVEELQTQLAAAHTRNAEQATLLGLFDQLDQLGIEAVLTGGLGVLLTQLNQLLPAGQLVKDANTAAHNLLTHFETNLLDLSAAMAWLGNKMVSLKVDLWLVEKTAQKVTNVALNGVLAVFGGFAGQVLNYLPFNIGDAVRQTFTATQGLLTTTVAVADDTNDQVMLKISPKVAGPQGWPTTLVQPLRTQTLAAAEQLATTVNTAATTIQTDLVAPTQTVLAQRQALREQIATYRAAKQL